MHTKPYYLKILEEELESRLARNSKYSLRAYARDLGFSASRLSEVLNQKKGISSQAALDVSRRLGLSLKEKEIFLSSVESVHARSSKNREAAKAILKTKLIDQSHRLAQEGFIEDHDFESIHNWYYFAILEVVAVLKKNANVKEISRRLQLNEKLVDQAVERLLKLNLLKESRGVLKASYELTSTRSDISSRAIKNFHSEILDKAKTALNEHDVEKREFQNMTLAFSQSDLKEAKAFIRKFQIEFAEKFSVKSPDSVYQLSIQFFKLDKQGVSNDEK